MGQHMSNDLKSLSLDDSYLLVAAIDFGTTFTGYAFSFKSKPSEIRMNKNWGAVFGCDSYKAPTCVMTNPDGTFNSFGYEAENEYSQLDPSDVVIGGPNGYNLYRHFKMILHDQEVNMSSKVVSTTGYITKAIDIFTMALEHLHRHMMDLIKNALQSPPKASDIRWVLTVPAIWRDEAKEFMREAAYQAKLIPEKNSKNLLIALEPEAASIFCRTLEIDCFNQSKGFEDALRFKSGQKILIIDAGGGTVDITAHEVLLDGNVKEISPPSGGPWGGITVDEKFISLLANIFGSDFINKFKVNQPQQWLQLMTAFEKSKKAFVSDGKSSIKIPPPYCLEKELTKFKQKDIAECVAMLGDRSISFNNGILMIKHEKAKSLFSENTSQIINHVMKLMSDPRLHGLNYILLVGGFGECKIIQDACQQAFSKWVKVLIPIEAQLAIVKGAILFGHNPGQITSRIARFTYGKKINYPFQEGTHDPAKKVLIRNKEECTDCFLVFVTKDEEICVKDSKCFSFHPSERAPKSIRLEFFKTEKKQVKYTDEPGVKQIATATFHNDGAPLSDDIEARVTFGHTEHLVEVRDKAKGGDFPLKISLNFLSD